MREWKRKNRERVSARDRALYEDRKRRGLCAVCGRAEPIPAQTRCPRCADRNARTRKRFQEKLKREVFAAYGGYRCACCGEAERKFLSIDHVNGGGQKHRRQIGDSEMYSWLRKNGFPPGFQVLCHNCNMGKALGGGVCPHRGGTTRPPSYQAFTWPC
jgi:hypothetical protein